MPDLTLGQLLRKYVEAEAAFREEAAPQLKQLNELMEQIRKIREPYDAQKAALFEKIKPLAVAELKDAPKKSRSFPGGVLHYRSPYEKHKWDNGKLQGYAAAHPEILAFYQPSPYPAVVTIDLD